MPPASPDCGVGAPGGKPRRLSRDARTRGEGKEAVSDVTITPGLDEPESYAPSARRQRRFARRALIAQPIRRPVPQEVTEGATVGEVNVREGLYRRTLAVADAFAAFVALTIVVV